MNENTIKKKELEEDLKKFEEEKDFKSKEFKSKEFKPDDFESYEFESNNYEKSKFESNNYETSKFSEEKKEFESKNVFENEECELDKYFEEKELKLIPEKEKNQIQILSNKNNERNEEKVKNKEKKTIFLKDLVKPEKALSAFFWFCEEEKLKFIDEQPNATEVEMAKEISERWIDFSPEKKEKYELLAQKDKKRYKKELKIYKKNKKRYNNQIEKLKNKKTFVRHPSKPERFLSAFFCFLKDESSKIRAEQPNATSAKIAKEIGERWSNCSSEKMLEYKNLLKKDEVRYEKELELYNALNCS